MACMTLNKDYVALLCNYRVLVSQIEKKSLVSVSSSNVYKLDNEYSECDPSPENTFSSILCVDLSPCCQWIALSSSNKELCVWRSSVSWELQCKWLLTRSAEKIKFTPSGHDVIVADKSGDAYLFAVENPASEGKLLLGHLSMLLDVLVSDDEKFIITSDRDEKIRVSHFPNAYNIQAYCLGHKEFVSSLSFLPHDKTVLLSGSGDGYIRFWNYLYGRQIHSMNCCEIVKSHCVKHTVDKSLDSNLRESINDEEGKSKSNFAIIQTNCINIDKSSLIAVCVETFKGILIFKASGNCEYVECSLTNVINLQEEPWDIKFLKNTLWYLCGNNEAPLNSVCLNNEGQVVHSERIVDPDAFYLFNEYCKSLKNVNMPDRKCVLYKRKFDNLMDYAEKKKARLTRINVKMD